MAMGRRWLAILVPPLPGFRFHVGMLPAVATAGYKPVATPWLLRLPLRVLPSTVGFTSVA